jgi:hypothetical protein
LASAKKGADNRDIFKSIQIAGERILSAGSSRRQYPNNHGAASLLKQLGYAFSKLRHIFADRVYRSDKLFNAITG